MAGIFLHLRLLDFESSYVVHNDSILESNTQVIKPGSHGKGILFSPYLVN